MHVYVYNNLFDIKYIKHVFTHYSQNFTLNFCFTIFFKYYFTSNEFIF